MKVLASLRENRKLILYLAQNDFKTKYAGSYLGIVWGFVQPIVTIVLYWFVFQIGLRSGDVGDTPFVLWLMAGLIPWFYFSEALVNASNCFVEYSYLVKKVVFNINILPLVKIISSLYVHIFFVLLMLVFYVFNGYYFGFEVLQLLYYSCCMIALVVSISYFTAAINIFFKDTMQIINVFMQIGMWMTPILWNIQMVEGSSSILTLILKLNPMFYVVQGYRDTMIDHIWFFERIYSSLYFWIVIILLTAISRIVYRRLRPHFSDSL